MHSGRRPGCHRLNSYLIARTRFVIRGMRSLVRSVISGSVLRAPSALQDTYRFRFVGGAEEARTPDPLLAKEVLSQLSYGPLLPRVRRQSSDVGTYRPLTFDIPRTRGMVGHSGLEPETSVLSGLRSNQLS